VGPVVLPARARPVASLPVPTGRPVVGMRPDPVVAEADTGLAPVRVPAPEWAAVGVAGRLRSPSRARAAIGVVIDAQDLPAPVATPGDPRSPAAGGRAQRRRIAAAGGDGLARTETIAGDGDRARRQGIPVEPPPLSRASISVTNGENSIPTKNAVASQIASLIRVTAAP
jgi:hypothetical protein